MGQVVKNVESFVQIVENIVMNVTNISVMIVDCAESVQGKNNGARNVTVVQVVRKYVVSAGGFAKIVRKSGVKTAVHVMIAWIGTAPAAEFVKTVQA